ncbi:hypothetical protein ACOME3_008021 [Neoechinorhynchus agilis]
MYGGLVCIGKELHRIISIALGMRGSDSQNLNSEHDTAAVDVPNLYVDRTRSCTASFFRSMDEIPKVKGPIPLVKLREMSEYSSDYNRELQGSLDENTITNAAIVRSEAFDAPMERCKFELTSNDYGEKDMIYNDYDSLSGIVERHAVNSTESSVASMSALESGNIIEFSSDSSLNDMNATNQSKYKNGLISVASMPGVFIAPRKPAITLSRAIQNWKDSKRLYGKK